MKIGILSLLVISSLVATESQFDSEVLYPLPQEIVERIKGKSWKEDCPVPLEDLAYIRLKHWTDEEQVAMGELIYHRNLAAEIVEIFEELFEQKFPIHKMRLIDDYGADDELSMADNNTSAFCSRPITGRVGVFSKHSYGGTIDLNPLVNPYVKGEIVLPIEGKNYLDRSLDTPGMIREGGACYEAFMKRGYRWGGHWQSLKDYQHFEKSPELFIPD